VVPRTRVNAIGKEAKIDQPILSSMIRTVQPLPRVSGTR
jgi:hypothetical protein